MVEEVAAENGELQPIGDPVARAGVEHAVAGHLLLGRSGAVVSHEGRAARHPPPLRRRAAAEHHEPARRGDAVGRRAVVEHLAAERVAPELQLETGRQVDAQLELEAADLRLAAVAEEEVTADAVALDEVLDAVGVGIHGRREPVRRVAQGEVELAAGLGLELRVAVDEAAARLADVVAVREQGVPEAARRLRGQLEAGTELQADGGEAGEGRARGAAVADGAPLIAARHHIAARAEIESPAAQTATEAREQAGVGAARRLDAGLAARLGRLPREVVCGVLVDRLEAVAAVEIEAEDQPPLPQGALGIDAEGVILGVHPRLGEVPRRRGGGVAVLGEDDQVVVPREAQTEPAPRPRPRPLEAEAQPVGALGRVVGPPLRRVRARLAGIARLVAAPQEVHHPTGRDRLPAEAEALQPRPRVEHRALRARVVAPVAVVGADHGAPPEQTGAELRGRTQLVDAGAADEAPAQLLRATRVGHPGPGPDHAAEGIRAVGHRARPAHDLDLVDGLWVEEARRGPGAALGAHAPVVEQEQGAVLRHAAQARHRRRPVAADLGPGQVLEALVQPARQPLIEVAAAHDRRRRRRRELEVGDHAADHGHGLAGRRDPDLERACSRELEDGDRPQRHPVGTRDEQHEGRLRRGWELEAALPVGEHRVAAVDNQDAGTGQGLPVRHHDPALDGQRHRRLAEAEAGRHHHRTRSDQDHPPPQVATSASSSSTIPRVMPQIRWPRKR